MPTTKMTLETAFEAMDRTSTVMIDRSNLFSKSFEALSNRNFHPVVDRFPELCGSESEFRTPLIYGFSYAQRVFLCSAIEMSLVYHHANSVGLVISRTPERISSLTNLMKVLHDRKKFKGTLADWVALDDDVRFTQLRELSFSRLGIASRFFDDIYGSGCFDTVWGAERHATLATCYSKYQDLRNGILHRGGEVSSGVNIPADEDDFKATFDDALSFRDAVLTLSRWCYDWWRNKRYATVF
jgi:hypothetical protein